MTGQEVIELIVLLVCFVVAALASGTDALILVRPDGYIGLIAGPEETEAVAGYLRSL